jgi:hypothetical protein
MAYSKDQNEPKVPISNVEQRNTSDLLPRFYRTKSNKKFLQATLDQLTQPGTVKKLNGFIGRETAKAVTSSDIFLSAPSKDRQDYQLEPAAVIQDYLGNTTFFKDYIDHISHFNTFNGNTDNHSRLNQEEFYSWNPHIDWDKFVNYQQYYWLPFGPSAIEVFGQQLAVQSTYTVTAVDETDNVAYLFTPNGLTRNPTLTLYRGQTYTFDIDTPGHPFSIKTTRTSGALDRFTNGVDGFSIESGKITFTVPVNCPDVLFYVSDATVDTGGVFHVLDITENTAVDLDADFLGKKEYIIPNGTAKGLAISNGMKLKFRGQVTPIKYADSFWYVEGVGTAITLINERDLEIRTSYKQETAVLFDDVPFDQLPFGDASTLPNVKDYITINKASPDGNPWSRYNRWFHQDVIIASATANSVDAEFDQTSRAARPIIEFNSGIKLHNYGIQSKANIDVIDSFTTDVFSTIEGSLGYNVDGIDLADGMRIMFTADSDTFVKNKIFKVNFIEVTPPLRTLTVDGVTAISTADNTITFAAEHGLSSGNRLTYLNNGNSDIPGLVNGKIYYVRVINTVTIDLHTSPALNTQVDIFNTSVGTHKFEVYAGFRRQINLVEEADGTPSLYDLVTVNYGTSEYISADILGNQGQTYWYTGSSWKLAQIKSKVNQPPLFDLFDINGVSLTDESVYSGSTFAGNKLFSYKTRETPPLQRGDKPFSLKVGDDATLGFPLSFRNIENIGDIVFEFNLVKDQFSYKKITDILTKNTDVGYLKIINAVGEFQYANGWTTSAVGNSQPVVRVFKDSNLGNDFPIDVYDKISELDDLEVRVYINGIRLSKTAYNIVTGVVRKFVHLNTAAALTDVITLRCFSRQPKNENGHYEFPISLQNNPLNNNIDQFTLGQVIDHVDSIIDNNSSVFEGAYPGNGNLRDLGNISQYGTRFVQHSGPMNLSLYHLGSKSSNLIKALDQARNDYGKFKRAFLIAASESGIDTDPRRHVDHVLQSIVKDKPTSSPYYLSDMFGYTASNRIEYNILDPRIKTYPLTSQFTLNLLSNKAVSIYLNGQQLIHGKDYVFGDDVFFELLIDFEETDLLEAYEYVTTDGCFCPPTPTKLGLYPLFEPRIYFDDTYTEPTNVIQGHDGSITVAFNDYRDDLLLELETRIFNNIKIKYDSEIFNIFNYIPGYERSTAYSRTEFDKILSKYFFQWTTNIQQDFTKHIGYDSTNSFTYNYRGSYTPNNQDSPASWRGVYLWLFDTDRPHLTPWECLGYSIEPTWWQEVYGPAPYTSDNLILWDDIKTGNIRQPGVPLRQNLAAAKSILNVGYPVNDQGQLVSPYDAGYLQGAITQGEDGYFTFGDNATVESTWRKSSYYPFAILETCLLMCPNDVLGRGIDRSRIIKNLNDQLIYAETGLRVRLQDLVLPSTVKTNNVARTYTAGLINYIVDYLTSENTARIDSYALDLKLLTNKITTRLGSFTNQPKYKILLDSKSPNSSGGVFVPEENYYVKLNISSAVKKVVYSGVLVTKFADGFELRGYNFDDPYFTYYPFRRDERVINVGGISESYLEWTAGQRYVTGKIVRANNQFYRVKTNHTSGAVFDSEFYVRLPELPVIGGRDAILRSEWDITDPQTIAYGTRIATYQEVVDILQGYGAYLEEAGFVFDDFNNNLSTITNWETSVKEFLFWSTQQWAVGSVISLSPAAEKLIFKSTLAVVEDTTDQFYGYNIFRVDGQKLDPEFISVYRTSGEFVLEPENTVHGIFGATLYLVQKEHVAVLDNTTLFNDTIYDPEAGYRQQRVKILGYVTSNWTGGFEIPGFIYDEAKIKLWEPWTDYNLGDIVKHKEFYYSAKKFLIGVGEFIADNWVLLDEKPTPELLPNWDYRAEQFTDFYDLDTDNLDSGQQKIAQHLIGYQKRQYLENIIQNDVSQYKFYQGMIVEKGTQNVLSKLFDVLSAEGVDSLTFDEEWAFRVGEYGAVDSFDEIEFILDEAEFKTNPQAIELVNTVDTGLVDFVYRQTPADVYIKPMDYTSSIWPTTDTANYLRTPGYVQAEDVKLNIDNLDELVGKDISTFIEGDYVWCAFEQREWNVYRFTRAPFKIDSAVFATGTVTVTCNRPPNLIVGDIVGIENSVLRGFHKITAVSLSTFSYSAVDNPGTIDPTSVLAYNLISQRIDNIDNANSMLPRRLKSGELLWVDDNGQDKWAVYKNAGTYRRGQIVNATPVADLTFGLSISISDNGNIAAISDSDRVTIYEKGSSDNAWASSFRITKPTSNATIDDFGALVKLSKDADWLAVSSPTASGYNIVGGTEEGYVSLYRRSPDGKYDFRTILQSPLPTDFEQFGSSIAFGKQTSTPEFFSNLSGVYAGSGSGALWNVIRTGATYTVLLVSAGLNYALGQSITILGNTLGGATIDNDLVITISGINASNGAVTSFEFTGSGPEDADIMAIAAIGAEQVHVYKYTKITDWQPVQTINAPANGTDFGYDIAMSADATKLVISAPNAVAGSGTVQVYNFDFELSIFAHLQSLSMNVPLDAERFGESVAVTATGNYIAVGSTLLDSDTITDAGAVLIYKASETGYDAAPYQTLTSPRKQASEQFGADVEFMNNDQTLIAFSLLGDVEDFVTSFDVFSNPLLGAPLYVNDPNSTPNQFSTTFDNNSLQFVDIVVDVGRIDVFDRYNTKFIYGESLINTSLPLSGYGKEIAVGANTLLTSAIFEPDTGYTNSGNAYSYVKPAGTTSWSIFHEQEAKVDVSKIKRAYLYDKSTSALLSYLDVVDPTQGKTPGPADQEIRFKTYFDPAIYSVGTSAVNIDDGMNWTTAQVGMLWWDLSRAKFLDSQSTNVAYRSTIWNKLYDTASIDVYEWVQTSLLPAAWNAQADTEAGLARGISGQTKYDNSVYSISKRYDSISKTFKETYYYWVSNKKVTPQVTGRTLTAYDVASLIADPISAGYSCLAFTGANSFSLVNGKKYLTNANTVLSIQYWITDNNEVNAHSQWKLLSTNRNTSIPTAIETKWFHSLVGKDTNDRVVPDTNLPLKQRYGIEFRPRQSMFVNRTEALKQFIERVNVSLATKLISDDYNLSPLNQHDPLPTVVSGLWDIEIDSAAELRFVPTVLVQTAQLSPVITNGRITNVIIVNAGHGYGALRVLDVDQFGNAISWYGPDVFITGTGTGAVIKTVVNAQGKIINSIITNSGEGYTVNTTTTVRNFAALVKSDEQTLGSWSIYSWDRINNDWLRTRVQSYDVRRYWSYLDWYATGYNEFVKIDYLVENTYELVTTEIELGSIVKVKNIGTGGWLLLEKYNNAATIDYTQNFNVIGRQAGTIKFLDNLYNFQNSTQGYDGPLFDADIFDNTPSNELTIILNAIKDNILIDEFRVDYLELFFASVRYAVQEQTFIDWAFKTSFVKSMHNVGDLTQKVNYNSDNLEFYEQYIKEVKPYRTKVREYVSNYSKLDNSQTSVTDFDLLPVINDNLEVSPLTVYLDDDGKLNSEFTQLTTYPWKHWVDALGFEIIEIVIVDGGSNYLTRPVINIDGVQIEGGTSAQATAYISNGKVNRIELINGGTRWTKAPIITVNGGLAPGGTPARAVAIIGNSVPRSNHIKIKFDRISSVFEITELQQVETFTGTGAKTQYNLKWSPDIGTGNAYVAINGVEVLSNEYTLTTVVSNTRGYTSFSGLLAFKVAPLATSNILVQYNKNFEHLSATDRINFYYNPTTGQFGKDLAQLMIGVDYGGVIISGLDFQVASGWDALPWFSDRWDTSDPTLDDFLVDVGTSIEYSYRLPYVPAIGMEINIYISRYNESTQRYEKSIKVDDPAYLTVNQTNVAAIMPTFIGDGEIDIVTLPNTAALAFKDRIVFRKITSDGSSGIRNADLDTVLGGGNLAYSTATGIAPDDINVDGDDFITATNSHAPEEIVPGQVMDTLAIKVYSRPSGGCPNIMFKNYVGNNTATEFAIGQYFATDRSIIVKVDDVIFNIGVDYTIDYQSNQIIFTTPPTSGQTINIVSISFNSENVLDLDYFVSDGVIVEYITKAPWLPTVSATVLVNGVPIEYELFSTDDRYTDVAGQTWRSRVGIRFFVAPSVGAIINYIIDAGDIEQNSSVVKSSTVAFETGTSTYSISDVIGVNPPFDQNVLVKTNQIILTPASANYFVMKDTNLIYTLQDYKFLNTIVASGDISVYRNGTLLIQGSQYIVDFDYTETAFGLLDSGVQIFDGSTGYSVDDILDVDGGQLTESGSVAKFVVMSVSGTGEVQTVELIASGSYVTLPTQPFTLTGGTGTGIVMTADITLLGDPKNISIELAANQYVEGAKLTVIVSTDADYVINNNSITFTNTYASGTLFEIISFYNHNVLGIERTVDRLIPAVDLIPGAPEYYELTDKLSGAFRLRNTAVSGDFVWVIKNGQLLMNNIDYYLDSDYVTIVLTNYLFETDVVQIIAFTNTVVHDSFAYMQFKDMLNRVHYKRLNKAKSTRLDKDLTQFDKDITVVDGSVLDEPNANKNLPGIIEINGERIEYFAKVGNILSQLHRGTLGTGMPVYHSKQTLVQCLGASETIPYNDEFVVKTHVSDGVSNTIELPYIPEINDIEVFVGGYRLKKLDYVVFQEINGYPYSPQTHISATDPVGTTKEGDTKFAAEFSITGKAELRLLVVPSMGVKVSIIKRQGKLWNDMGKRLAKSNNPVANFLKETGTNWPDLTIDKYEDRIFVRENDPLQSGDGEPLEF